MKTVRSLSIGILAFLIGVMLAFAVSGKLTNAIGISAETVTGEKSVNSYSDTPIFGTKSTGSMGTGDTIIELTPRLVDDGSLVVNFKINTHSVALSQFDFTKNAVLEHEGKSLKPVEASRVGGHHSSGKIIFDIGGEINSFKIKISGIPKVRDRIYEWNVG